MIELIINLEQTGASGVKRLRCSLSVSNPSHTLCAQTEADSSQSHLAAVNHTGGDDGRCCHLSVQLARRHGQAERRLPAECPGHQQTFVLHLLQAHHHLLGDRRDRRPGEGQVTKDYKRLQLWF